MSSNHHRVWNTVANNAKRRDEPRPTQSVLCKSLCNLLSCTQLEQILCTAQRVNKPLFTKHQLRTCDIRPNHDRVLETFANKATRREKSRHNQCGWVLSHNTADQNLRRSQCVLCLYLKDDAYLCQ